MQNDTLQIKVSSELLDLIRRTAELLSGFDVSEIVRRTSRWLLNPQQGEERLQVVQKKNLECTTWRMSGPNNVLIKVRSCPRPTCSMQDLRDAIQYRCEDTIAKTPPESLFHTDLVCGRDFIIAKPSE